MTDTATLVLGLRVLVSLAAVLGVLWYAARRMQGKGGAARRKVTPIAVVGRQSLGGKSGVTIVEVDGRRLLLGVSERGVSLLTELEPAPAVAEPRAERVEIDMAELGLVDPDPRPTDLSDLDLADLDLAELDDLSAPSTPSTPSTPAARMPAVPKPRHPLEGSILDAATWRQAVVAVQERTIRR